MNSGTVALYATDDMSGFSQVTATITRVQLVNTGSGASCDVLTTPVTVDIANLSSVLQLLSVTSCTSGPYNRIHIEFDQSVQLLSSGDATPTLCSFTSYLDEHSMPNALSCSGTTCSLDINGAVNVLASQNNSLALDFNLKDFEVTTSPTCTVTMKVSPLNASEMESLHREEGITGLISNLNTTAKTFTLTRGNMTFTVDYSGTTAAQPGIDTLLQRAQTDTLRVKVLTPASIDFTNNRIVASAVYVLVEGTVSVLDTVNHTFTLTYQTTKTIPVSYDAALAAGRVEGTLSGGAAVEVKLLGFDGTNYTAYQVEVEIENEIMGMDT